MYVFVCVHVCVCVWVCVCVCVCVKAEGHVSDICVHCVFLMYDICFACLPYVRCIGDSVRGKLPLFDRDISLCAGPSIYPRVLLCLFVCSFVYALGSVEKG